MEPGVSTAMAMITIIEKLGGWSVGGFLAFVTITPAIFVYLSARIVVKSINGLRSELAEHKRDYEDNVRFVSSHQKLVDRLDDTLRRYTIAMTRLIDRFDTMKEVK